MGSSVKRYSMRYATQPLGVEKNSCVIYRLICGIKFCRLKQKHYPQNHPVGGGQHLPYRMLRTPQCVSIRSGRRSSAIIQAFPIVGENFSKFPLHITPRALPLIIVRTPNMK